MPVVESNVFIMDNGGHTIKAGYSTQSNPRIIPNSIMKAKSEKRRAFIGDQIDDCRDLSSLFYMLPFQKGFLVNWDHQKTIWDYLFGKHCFKLNASSLKLLLTEPYFNFSSIQEGLSEIFFEEYEFHSLFRTHPGDLVAYQNKVDHPGQQCCLVVDTGFSFTHVVPYVLGKRVRSAVRRIDVGGKLLTNHLKEVTSYRQLHVLDETYVMNTAKEDCCFVSQDVDKDLAIAKKRGKENTISRDYVLPDFTSIRRGFMKSQGDSTGRAEDGEQIIRLNNERFMVPEILLSPADIGIQQLGLAETVVNSVSACEESAQPWLYANIVLVGGCALFRGIRERLEREVRTMAPQMMEVKVSVAGEGGVDPIQCAWRGGASLTKDTEFANLCVTREDYLEEGYNACQKKFYL